MGGNGGKWGEMGGNGGKWEKMGGNGHFKHMSKLTTIARYEMRKCIGHSTTLYQSKQHLSPSDL